jgi:hypothetical protein
MEKGDEGRDRERERERERERAVDEEERWTKKIERGVERPHLRDWACGKERKKGGECC